MDFIPFSGKFGFEKYEYPNCIARSVNFHHVFEKKSDNYDYIVYSDILYEWDSELYLRLHKKYNLRLFDQNKNIFSSVELFLKEYFDDNYLRLNSIEHGMSFWGAFGGFYIFRFSSITLDITKLKGKLLINKKNYLC